MAFGSRLGSKSRIYGSKVGSLADDEGGSTVNPMAGVSFDATSLKYVPNTAAEWTITMAAAGIASGNPSSLWRCQEAAGNLADSIGSLTLTAANTPSYNQAVTGWSRLALQTTDGGNSRFRAVAATGPDPSATSTLWLWYQNCTAAAAARTMCVAGGSLTTNDVSTRISATGKLENRCVNVVTDGTSSPIGAGVLPVVLQYNRTGASVLSATSAEKVVGTYNSGAVDGPKGAPSGQDSSPGLQILYGVMFQGSAAEMSSAQIKSLLSVLGWSIPWS